MLQKRNMRGRFWLTLLFACRFVFSQGMIDESGVWHNYLDWLRKQPPGAGIPDYRSHLAADGLPGPQAEAYISIVEKLAKERRLEIVAIDFDKYYVAETDNYSKQPNAFLVGIVSRLKPSTALDAAMGQGRNAVFLAEMGWDVTGFDIAGEGLRLARERAAKAGLKINTIQSTHQDFDFGRDRWDLIVLTYSWAPFDDPTFMRRLSDSLKPGGWVVVEDNEGSIHVRDPGVNPLLKWFEDFRILRYEQASSGGDWGNRKNAVYRLLGQKH
ncbi:MAG: class I SAM-dependent methyltransferase [Bryobacteraceae bacterium]